MPELNIMSLSSTVDDLNLDFSDRNPELRRKKFVWEFSLHDSDSDDGDLEDEGEGEGQGHLEDDGEGYFFDQGLDFNYDSFNKKRIVLNGSVESINTQTNKTVDNVKAIPNGECTKTTDKAEQDKVQDVTIKLEKTNLEIARRNDREEIRKKLAMGADDDDLYDDDDDISYKKPNLQSRLHSGLQICFMNESPGDTDSEGLSPRQHEIHDNMKLMSKGDDLVDSDNNLKSVTDLNRTAAGTSQEKSSNSPSRLKEKTTTDQPAKCDDFHSRQEQLQEEAKLALAQAGTMARMQLEIEKQTQTKSPMAEMVGIPGLGERRRKKLGLRKLQEMNLAQIQVLYNDLQTQIENLNEELVHLLMERDELHMEQDSMLVDIEDLTRRAEELAEKSNAKAAAKNSKNHVTGKVGGR